MDEVENLSIETQRMLLRAMEERRYRPVGGQRDRLMDVRIIAATNEDLQEAVAEKRFRKDLLYRFQDLPSPYLHCIIAWRTYFLWRIFPGAILRVAPERGLGF